VGVLKGYVGVGLFINLEKTAPHGRLIPEDVREKACNGKNREGRQSFEYGGFLQEDHLLQRYCRLLWCKGRPTGQTNPAVTINSAKKEKAMTRKLVFISVALAGMVLAVSSYSWADGAYHGGHYIKGGHGPARYHRGHAIDQRFRHGHAIGHRFRHPPRWGHHPRFHRHHPSCSHWRGRRPVVVKQINNYYGGSTTDAYVEDSYQASASVSESAFSFSIGISGSR
jgi:hypothetical protein